MFEVNRNPKFIIKNLKVIINFATIPQPLLLLPLPKEYKYTSHLPPQVPAQNGKGAAATCIPQHLSLLLHRADSAQKHLLLSKAP